MSDEDPRGQRRRDFVSIAVQGSAVAFAGAMGYPAARFVQPEERPHRGPAIVGKIEAFPPGSVKTVLFNDRPVLVIRSADGRLRAFSAICTHLQCIVGYVAERNQIECPCHRGVYTMDGENVSGPPPRRLGELPVTVNEGSVVLSPAE
jgi:cytochrome b6-f complex iron-sulfur subunit